MDPVVMTLATKMRDMAIKRQKDSNILKTASWALYHRAELKELVSNITMLIDNLEKLFPAPQMLALARQETANISNKQELQLVQNAAQDVDDLLCAAAKESLTGHQYLGVTIKGKAQTGDAYSGDWKGEVVGVSHTYDGVEVQKDGKALVGNKYGGKDFWDD
jgi:succinate dehydrogenase/fumarate reductase-like Fe-S protein